MCNDQDDVRPIAEELLPSPRFSTKEPVRRALHREPERLGDASALAERGLAFVRSLHSKAGPDARIAADKAFIDDLYT